ncbi:WD40 repeat domain-containing protein [Thermogemmatispora aurantia]|uniref:WD40 repeat domain-containing protein n=1 Tax=Thermogemmatispora aurantia TaxID=2045279 RepID=UPI00124C9F23|nr:hypothetical protein [Thermogemmatispora aurantia]
MPCTFCGTALLPEARRCFRCGQMATAAEDERSRSGGQPDPMTSSWRLSSPLSTSLPGSLVSSPSTLPPPGFTTPLPPATKANIRGPRLLAWRRFLAWSPDSQLLASVGKDGTVQLWEAASGQGLLTYHGHSGTVLASSYSTNA